MARGHRHGTSGKRLYRCDECKAGTFFSRKEENRAARLRCSACGSARLTVSRAGIDQIVDGMDAKREAAVQVDKNGTGSIVPD